MLLCTLRSDALLGRRWPRSRDQVIVGPPLHRAGGLICSPQPTSLSAFAYSPCRPPDAPDVRRYLSIFPLSQLRPRGARSRFALEKAPVVRSAMRPLSQTLPAHLPDWMGSRARKPSDDVDNRDHETRREQRVGASFRPRGGGRTHQLVALAVFHDRGYRRHPRAFELASPSNPVNAPVRFDLEASLHCGRRVLSQGRTANAHHADAIGIKGRWTDSAAHRARRAVCMANRQMQKAKLVEVSK